MEGISLESAWITSFLVTGDTEKFSSLYHSKKGADALWVGSAVYVLLMLVNVCVSTVDQTRR